MNQPPNTPAGHDHIDPDHQKDLDGRCCCCNARWTPVPFPGSGCEMIHRDDCPFLDSLPTLGELLGKGVELEGYSPN